MKPSIRTAWIDRLRSGKELQTTGDLIATMTAMDRDYGKVTEPGQCGYCCLGVLTVLYIEAGGKDVRIKDNHVEIKVDETGLLRRGHWVKPEEAILPHVVTRWAGLTYANPWVGDWAATSLNDTKGLTFAEIADHIEAHDPN